MKALVTGGTGLVGRYIVETLLAAGYEVVVAGRTKPAKDLFSQPVEFRPARLDPDWKPGDLFDGIDAFIHAAFEHLPGRYRGGEGDDPDGFRRSNLDGPVGLFNAARNAGSHRVVFLSSRAVYDGVPPGTPLTEDLPLQPTSLYGEIKLAAEQALAAMNAPHFITSSLRLTGVYGELRPNKWDTLFADYLAGRPVPVRAGSEVHGRDAGQAVRLMLVANPDRIGGEVFNVSDLVADTREILAPLRRVLQNPPHLPQAADKTAVARMDTQKIRALGWQPGGKPLLTETMARLVGNL
ncbi:nucleoside-diphosphate-sugar epimerase [Hoeflea halophila]|uniref:Nucleoside-diphosphate-sugar epimerase n=1 Tax=Hoeflea halophila TaxID=714899 RepID=A0A286I8H4_9HYPH|nr:NAD(P)-dependent oxidoreductase [Hoeflea halophila]SOE16297.1 nucleoside-diphosphate-sugar epimerase [Hoeflea halophila]